VEDLITNYFFGHDKAIGKIYEGQEDFEHVAIPMLALTVTVVRDGRLDSKYASLLIHYNM
jgi:hypothetical protein